MRKDSPQIYRYSKIKVYNLSRLDISVQNKKFAILKKMKSNYYYSLDKYIKVKEC